MADSMTEHHLSVMSQQTTTATNQQALCMPLYMHGTCLDLYRASGLWTPRTAIYWSFTV